MPQLNQPTTESKAAISNAVVVILSFIAASVVNVYPVDVSYAIYRPMALIMVLVFWLMFLPKYISIGVALIVGLIVDLLVDTQLGQQGFAAVVMAFCLQTAVGRFKELGGLKAWLVACLAMSIFQTTLWVVQYMTQSVFTLSSVWPLLVSMVSWGPMYVILIRCL